MNKIIRLLDFLLLWSIIIGFLFLLAYLLTLPMDYMPYNYGVYYLIILVIAMITVITYIGLKRNWGVKRMKIGGDE